MSCDLTDADLTRIYNQANDIADGQHVPITTERIFAAMRAAMASANQRAEYAWRNTNTIEKSRQEEMTTRNELLAVLEAAVAWAKPMEAAPVDARPIWFDQARVAIAKVKP